MFKEINIDRLFLVSLFHCFIFILFPECWILFCMLFYSMLWLMHMLLEYINRGIKFAKNLHNNSSRYFWIKENNISYLCTFFYEWIYYCQINKQLLMDFFPSQNNSTFWIFLGLEPRVTSILHYVNCTCYYLQSRLLKK